jgi:EH domain-containing protein 1
MEPEDAAKAERDAATRAVIDELKVLYKQKLLPVEQTFMFNRFYSPLMTDSEFEAKPMVLLIGQYSTGKTTFIRYLLGCDFPGQRIGPEPTTDRFVAVLSGHEDRILPGNGDCVRALRMLSSQRGAHACTPPL